MLWGRRQLYYCSVLYTLVYEFLEYGSAFNDASLSSMLCFQQCSMVQFGTEQYASVSLSFKAGYQLGGVHQTSCYLGWHIWQNMVYCRQEGPRPIKPAVWNLRLSRGSENKKAVSHKFQHALLACHKQQAEYGKEGSHWNKEINRHFRKIWLRASDITKGLFRIGTGR